MWQQRSSKSRSVAAGIRSLAPQSRQMRSTALRRISIPYRPLPQAQVLDALRESGSTLVLIEDRNQTGCVLPDGYSLDGYTGDMVKGFWLNQTFRARYQTQQNCRVLAQPRAVAPRSTRSGGQWASWVSPQMPQGT